MIGINMCDCEYYRTYLCPFYISEPDVYDCADCSMGDDDCEEEW